MTDKLFDNFIQDKLHGHSSQVPEGLWSKIEKELAAEEEDRKAIWFRRWYWAAAILVLALSSAAWLYWQGNAKTELSGNKVVIDNSNTTVAGNNNPASPLPSTPATTAPATTVEETAAITSNNAAKPEASAEKAASLPQQTITSTSASTVQAVRRSVRNDVTVTDISRNEYEAHSTSATNNNNTILNSATTGGEANANVTATESARFATLFATTEAVPQASQTDYAAALRQYMQKQDNSFFPIIRCPPVRNTVPSDLYIEAYVSPDKVFRQISANNGATGYVTNRDTSLSLRTSFTAGIRLSKALTENLLLKAGLQYSQINENFNYRLENERKQITVVTTHTITNAPGDTVVVRDTSTYEQIGYLQKKVKNRYRNIDIPVLLSYEWGNDQWRFAVNGGPIINLHSWYSGEMPDTTNQPVSVKSGSNEVFKKNIGIGLYAGISVIKTINEKMDLFAEPYFRYNLTDMTQKGQAFNQKLNTAGLSLGIRYRINGGQRY